MGSERKGSEVKKNSRFIFDPFSCRLVVSVVETKTIVGLVNNEGNASALIVCAFVGETKTIGKFSLALQGPFKLGLRQGLAKHT